MMVLTLVPCSQDDPCKCRHQLQCTCTVRGATFENLRLAGLDPETHEEAICVVEDKDGNIILCRYCGSIREKQSAEWEAPSSNRRVI
jgi:hypothetical protein